MVVLQVCQDVTDFDVCFICVTLLSGVLNGVEEEEVEDTGAEVECFFCLRFGLLKERKRRGRKGMLVE